jgi:hypothetical protein
MSYYTVSPIATKPFIDIKRENNTGDTPPVDITLDVPLISQPQGFTFSKSLEQVAISYDARADNIDGITNPTDLPPATGIRVFSGNDRFLLFGGSATETAKLYFKAGPTFLVDGVFVAPTSPAFIQAATFFNYSNALATVESSDLRSIKIYNVNQGGTTLAQTVAVPVADDIVSIEEVGETNLLIVRFLTNDPIVYEAPAMTQLTLPAGRLIAVNKGGSRFLMDPGASDDFELHTYDVGAFNTVADIANSGSMFLGASGFVHADGLTVILWDVGNTRVFATYDLGVTFEETNLIVGSGTGNTVSDTHFEKDDQTLLAIQTRDDSFEIVERDVITPLPTDFLGSNQLNSTAQTYVNRDGDLALSREGGFIRKWVWTGTAWDRVGVVAISGSWSSLTGVSFSENGQYAALSMNDSPYFVVLDVTPTNPVLVSVSGSTVTRVVNDVQFQDTGTDFFTFSAPNAVSTDTFVQHFSFNSGSALFERQSSYTMNLPVSLGGMELARSGDRALTFSSGSSNPIQFFEVSATAFTPFLDLDLPLDRGVFDADFSADGQTVFVASRPEANNDIFLYAYEELVQYRHFRRASFNLLNVNAAINNVSDVKFNPVGNVVIVVFGTPTEQRCALIKWTGSEFKLIGTFDNPTTTDANLSEAYLSEDGGRLTLIGNSKMPTYSWSVKPDALTYINRVQGSGLIDTMKADGSILHFGNNHVDPITLGAVTSLPFEPDAPANTVSNVLYSPTGNNVIWEVGGQLNLAIGSGSNAYTKLNTLDGTFISIYKIQGDQLQEKDFIAHEGSVTVEHMKFSETPVAFTYVAREDATTAHRRVYDVFQDRVDFKGRIDRTDMVGSFAAFSPAEEYWVATYDYGGGVTEIEHYKFDTLLNFSAVDLEPVPFGPCAYSSCRDVVVAHGGSLNPFTMYTAVMDDLVPRSFDNDFNWTNGVILDIEFGATCQDLVVLVPGEIIPIDVDQDFTEGEGVPVDPTDEDLIPGTDDEVASGGGGGGGGAGVGNGGTSGPGTITKRTYIPYVSINVVYRAQNR